MSRSTEYGEKQKSIQTLIETNKAKLSKLDALQVSSYLAMAQFSLTTELEAFEWLQRITTLIEKL